MIVMGFDLSTNLIGLVTADVDEKNKIIRKMRSCPVIPPKFNPEVLGYHKNKKKLPMANGELTTTYYKHGETTITKAEKEKRDTEVRKSKDIYVMSELSRQLDYFIINIKPDLILVEQNNIFNGILTSILLAKVYGNLLALAAKENIPFKEYDVKKVRSILEMPKLLREFVNDTTPEYRASIPDVSKRAIRWALQKEYEHTGIKFHSDDESDACAVINYWFKVDL